MNVASSMSFGWEVPVFYGWVDSSGFEARPVPVEKPGFLMRMWAA